MALMELNEWKKVYSFNLDKKNFVNNVVKYTNEHEVEDLPLFHNRSHSSCIIIKQHDEKKNAGNELKVFLVQPLGYK